MSELNQKALFLAKIGEALLFQKGKKKKWGITMVITYKLSGFNDDIRKIQA